MTYLRIVWFCLLTVPLLCSAESLSELKAKEARLVDELVAVRAAIADLEKDGTAKALNLNLLLSSLSDNTRHYESRRTIAELNEVSDLLREKTKPVVDGKSLTLNLEIQKIKIKRNGTTVRLDVVRGNGLPFLDTPPNERKSRAEIIRRLEINMTEHEAASLSVGDPLTLTGTAYFVRSRRDRKELPKDVLDAVTIRLDGAALGSTFGTIVISDAEVKVEKTGRTYLPGD